MKKFGIFLVLYLSFTVFQTIYGRQNYDHKTSPTDNPITGIESPIKVMLPFSSFVKKNAVTIKWYLEDNEELKKITTKKYYLTIKNLFDETLFATTTGKESLSIDLNHPLFQKERLLIFQVSLTGFDVHSKEYGVKFINADRIEEIDSKISSLVSEGYSYQVLISLAQLFVEHQLYANAFYAYERALILTDSSNQVEEYRLFQERMKTEAISYQRTASLTKPQ